MAIDSEEKKKLWSYGVMEFGRRGMIGQVQNWRRQLEASNVSPRSSQDRGLSLVRAKQSNAEQSKAKQSKAKQSKA
eukprot:CAMPEP_0171525078 /NCGR_PEP_ID=MMETSP0959-20130129/9472_1 /TAXON_ID=87120 /ORGANISM="Aurantiochytrium limacinum, Strain ATCCMYA-1381" /LENGTH=75 /DNA_ID=CAMNT_0012066019 /DNA_START=311 /DNA_END=535 /DNA_ORIENTATION=+